MKKYFLLFILLSTIVVSQVYFLSNDGVYKSLEKIKTGIFSGIVTIENKIYIIKHNAILNLDTGKEIEIESPTYVGENYFLSFNKLYKLENDNLMFVKLISDDLKYVQVYKEFIFGIQLGQVVAIKDGKIIWTISPNNETFERLKLSNGYLAVFTEKGLVIFNVTEPMYPKYIEHYAHAQDYEFIGYHAILYNNEIRIYDNNNKLVFSRKVNGKKLISDGENLYIGNYIITKDLNVTTYPYQINGVAVLQNNTIPKGEIKVLWTYDLNLEVKAKPVANNGILFVGTTNGKIMALKNGSIIWDYRLPFIITGHLTLTDDTLIVTCWDNNVYAFSYYGNFQWKVTLDSDLTLGVAWDGMIIYALSDEGILYEIRDGKVINQYKIGKWPISGPYVSLSGKIYSVDAMGYLWIDNHKEKFVGKIKNIAFFSENPVIPPENSFVLLDDFGNEYIFEKYKILKNNKVIFNSDEEIIDGILGKNNIYILTSSGKILFIDRKDYKINYTTSFPETRHLVFDDGILYGVGKKVIAISTNDVNPDSWFNIFKDNMNSSSINN